MKYLALFPLLAAIVLPVSAEVPRMIYAQHLVDELVARYPDILLIGLHVTPPGQSGNIIIASNFGRLGKQGDEDDLGVINTGRTKSEPNKAGTRYAVELVMRDVAGGTIGALGLNFGLKPGDDRTMLERRAETIRDELARHSADAANLLEPYPYVATATTKLHAQKLVDQLLQRNPDILVLTLNVLGANASAPLAASNIGQHGRAADADELAVIQSGRVLVTATGPERTRLTLPLQDSGGRTVGALGLVFRAGDAVALQRRAEQLRNELRSLVPAAQSLLDLDP